MANLSSFTNGTLQEISLINTIIQHLTANSIDFRVIPSYKTYSYKLKKFADIDVLLLTEFGLYAIETKSYRSHIKGSYNDKMWKGNTYNKVTHLYNPVFQNKEHIRSLNTVMTRNNQPRLQIENIVCIRNTCKNKTDCTEVMTESQFITRLILDSRYKRKYINLKEMMRVLLRFAI